MENIYDKLNPSALEQLEVGLYKVPLRFVIKDSYLVAKIVYYPKECGLFMNERVCKVYDNVFTSESEFDLDKLLSKQKLLTPPCLLSRRPRMRGELKWKKLRAIDPVIEDLILTTFKNKGGARSWLSDEVTIHSLCRKGFRLKRELTVDLPIYQHSTSDFITYIMSFEYLKKSYKNPRRQLTNYKEEIRGDMWKSLAYEMVFDKKL